MPKLKNIEYYMNETPLEGEPDKFTMFNAWCKKEGVVMPKLQYPAYFDNGELLGVKCLEQIEHREAYMFVPLKMVMSLQKAWEHPVLGKIIDENPEVFMEGKHCDYEQMILALFLFYELTLGRNSYWYPYLRLMPDVEFTSSWSEEELKETHDK